MAATSHNVSTGARAGWKARVEGPGVSSPRVWKIHDKEHSGDRARSKTVGRRAVVVYYGS
jgi:hypothetical protein